LRCADWHITTFLTLRGLGHEKEFKYFDKNELFWVYVNKSLYQFLNFENELMSCRFFHFPSGSGGNIYEKFYVMEFAAELLAGPPCDPIGSLVELLTPIGLLFQL
jgi:hypothetical protein